MGCTLTTEEVAHIDRTIADLKSENDGYAGELTRLGLQVGLLRHENDKLRKLVRVLYYCTTSGECDECPVNGGGAVHLMPDTICDTMHDRMHELEVDDG